MEKEIPPIVVVATSELRERLNHYYSLAKDSRQREFKADHFYDLWDLKELALLQEKDTVCVPAPWFDEIKSDESQSYDTKQAS